MFMSSIQATDLVYGEFSISGRRRSLAMQRLQFLYLIASGNEDSIYKVGISDDPKRRLEQIKDKYGVPRAYIVETMDVPTRLEVVALENAIHTRFSKKRSTRYGGREFFRFSKQDLDWIVSTFNERSNDFAQAKAFYGLFARAETLSTDATKLERQRQSKIDFNRSNGKIYNTKPSGALKEYNDIKGKMANGYLATRFTIKTFDHPSETLRRSLQNQIWDIINQRVGKQWLCCAACGFIGGLIIGSSTVANEAISHGFTGLFIGVISGAVSQSKRSESEKLIANKIVAEEIDALYPNTRQLKMIAIIDHKAETSFLIRDFNESTSLIREAPALLPKVELPSQQRIYDAFNSRIYFPFIAVVVTLGTTLLIATTNARQDPENQNRALPANQM